MSKASVGELIATVSVANQLGEGVQWHSDSQMLWWTDIEKSCLFRYSVTSKETSFYSMPERVGCFSFVKNKNVLIIAFASGIALYDIHSKGLHWLAQPEKHIKGNRFNDGRVDRQGRLWAGTMVENNTESANNNAPKAALYCVDVNKQCQQVITDIEISNGLCWSPDSLTMYHADSPKRQIYQYDFDPASAAVSNKRLFATTKAGNFPDGSCVDSQGYMWNAQWGGSKVVRYQPNGDIDLVLEVPVSQPSCVAIGGPNMDWLFITSAKQDLTTEQLKDQPLAGHLFIYQLKGVTGLPECQYICS